MSKQAWIGIGVLTGIIIARLIYPYIGSFAVKKTVNKVTNEQVQQFLAKSKDVELTFADYKFGYSYYDDAMRTKDVIRRNYVFCDLNSKKYFALVGFQDAFLIQGIMDEMKNNIIKCTVNTEQLQNPAYGDAKNPIPVFRCNINMSDLKTEYAKHCIREFNLFNNNYQDAVFKNLTYFTPKEEFQKMFPDQK
jgi:hypothetical protein